jgi:hypothetical protein
VANFTTREFTIDDFADCQLSIINCQFLRAFPQEIVSQKFRDFYQQGKVDARLFQHLIGVAAVGMYGSGKPSDRPSLSFQFLPYHISDVNFFHKKMSRANFIFLEGLEYLRKSIKKLAT